MPSMVYAFWPVTSHPEITASGLQSMMGRFSLLIRKKPVLHRLYIRLQVKCEPITGAAIVSMRSGLWSLMAFVVSLAIMLTIPEFTS